MFYPYAFTGRSDCAQIKSFQREYNHTRQPLKKQCDKVIGTRETRSYRCTKLRHPATMNIVVLQKKFKLLAATGSAPAKVVCIRYKLSRNGDNRPTVLAL